MARDSARVTTSRCWARGARAEQLRRDGVVLQDAVTSKRTVARAPVIERLSPEDRYDLVVVLVRKSQLPSVLPVVAANCSPIVLFMVNTASGYDDLRAAVGRERLLVGFAGAGGTLREVWSSTRSRRGCCSARPSASPTGPSPTACAWSPRRSPTRAFRWRSSATWTRGRRATSPGSARSPTPSTRPAVTPDA
jgi:Ketopantoate reductase PanE/ApbA